MIHRPSGTAPLPDKDPAPPGPTEPPPAAGFKTAPPALAAQAAGLHPPGTSKQAADARLAQPHMRAVEHGDLSWIDVQHPSGSEIEWLHTHYPNIHTLHFLDVTSPYQQPKLDERTDYLFLVLHFPFLDPETGLTVASEVDVFVGPGYVITAHAGQLRPLLGLFDQINDISATRAAVMSQGSGYLLYTVIDKLVEYCFPILNKIDQDLERIEGMIFTDTSRRSVFEIAAVRRDILAFRHVIRPQLAVMSDLHGRAGALTPLLGGDFGEYFDNLNHRLAKIWDTIVDHKETIESLSATHDSMVNAHLNNVLKILTVFSVVMLPLTLISSIYGMNFEVLPGSKDPYGFWIAMGSMAVIVVLMILFFKWRRWV